LMANLASLRRPDAYASQAAADPRAAVVQLDTVDTGRRDSSPDISIPTAYESLPDQDQLTAQAQNKRRVTRQMKRIPLTASGDEEDTRPGVRMSDLLLHRDKK